MAKEGEKNLFDDVSFDLTGSLGSHEDDIYIDTEETISTIQEPKEKITVSDPTKVEDKKDDLDDELIDVDEVTQTNNEDEDGDENTTQDKNTPKKPLPKDNFSPSTTSSFKVFAKALVEEGVYSDFNEEEWEKLVEEEGDEYRALISLQKRDIERFKEEYKNSLTEEERAIYEGKESGVRLDRLGQIDRVLNIYKNISDETIESDEFSDDIKKNIIAEDLKIRGLSDEEIKDELELYEDSGKLTIKAKHAKKRIQSQLENERKSLFQEAKLKEQQAKEQYELKLKNLKSTIEVTNEILPGFQLTSKQKEELYKSMTTIAEEDENGVKYDAVGAMRKRNPEKFAMVLHYLHNIGVLRFDKDGNFKPDLSKINNKASKNAAKELEESLKTSSFLSGSKNKSYRTSNFSLTDAI